MPASLVDEFIEQSMFRIGENLPRIRKCLEDLDERTIWQKPNPNSNSIGNLILHLCGNMRQYAISSLGNAPDTRIRDLEFSTEGGYSKKELIEKLASTVDEVFSVIEKMDEAELLKVRNVQGFELTGIGIIIHVVEHYSYHTGQIAFWTKQLLNKDLGFYAGINLNEKNQI